MRVDPSSGQAAAATPGGSIRVTKAQIWMVLLLVVASVLAFADRSILSILLDPVKEDLQIDDVKASFLMGLSFSVIYSLAALPFGALVDRVDRRRLIALSIVVWSAMTIFSGFAKGFEHFFVGRMGLGVAEAALGPAAFSLIRDSFSVDKRGRAFATLQASHLIGTGTALFGGGALFGLANSGAFGHIPLLGAMHPWQQVLIILGVIGLPVAALFMTIKEPARVATAAMKAKAPGFGKTLKFVWLNKRVFLPFWAGIALLQIAQGGLSGWTAMTVHRTWDIPIPAIGAVLGPVQIVMGLLGAFVFGTTLDFATKKGVRDAPLVVACIWLTLVGVIALGIYFINDLKMALGFYMVMLLFVGANSTSAAAALALLAPRPLAGKLQSITGLAINLVGLAFGATVVAYAGKHIFLGAHSMHHALTATVAVFMFLGVGMYLLTVKMLKGWRETGKLDYEGES